jgi:hypothetical protein
MRSLAWLGAILIGIAFPPIGLTMLLIGFVWFCQSYAMYMAVGEETREQRELARREMELARRDAGVRSRLKSVEGSVSFRNRR